MNFSTVFFLFGIVVVVMVLVRRSQRNAETARRLPRSFAHVDHGTATTRGHNLGLPQPAIEWDVHMEERTRALTAELDSKMSALAHLVREADRAAARLESALAGKAPGAHAAAVHNPYARDLAAQETHAHDAAALEAEVLPMSGAANQADHLRAELPAGAESAQAAVAAEPDSGGSLRQQQRDEIYLFADYGFDSAEIARRVGVPVGEVELILGLRQK